MFNRIRNLREDKDLTQKKLSTILHCSQQVYSNYELGQRDIPTDILIRLARFYGTSIDYLLGETDRKEPYPKK
ncbi:MAG: helix-turn-helix transcriptional regulator [Oscillospiraceae bacterium]